MASDDLIRQRGDLLKEIEQLSAVVEPMLRRREALARRAAAIETLLEPLEPRPGALDVEVGSRGADRRLVEATLFRNQQAHGVIRHQVAEVPRVYRPAPPAETKVDASRLIKEILEEARRPLHRLEILYRSLVHPLGPLNSNTMSTRLSRDADTFEKLRRRAATPPGYWVLADWPEDWKRVERIRPEGRIYVEALVQLLRERSRLRQVFQETGVMERRMAELHMRPAEGLREEEAERYRRLERFLQRQLERLAFSTGRTRALVTSLWETANVTWRALGDEAQKYPAVPPVDAQAPGREPAPGHEAESLALAYEGEVDDEEGGG